MTSELITKFNMAAQPSRSKAQPTFKRYTALEALAEILNDEDSGDEDFGGADSDFSDEEETDFNQHHPLLAEMSVEDDDDPVFFPHTSEETTSASDDEAMPIADPGPSTSTAVPRVTRGQARGRGRGRRVLVGPQRARGRGRGIVPLLFYVKSLPSIRAKIII